MVNPYNDFYDIRIFDEKINESELVWHRDKEDRIIQVISGEGWGFQYEDKLPFEMKRGCKFCIPKMMYHRIFNKGKTTLILKIIKN